MKSREAARKGSLVAEVLAGAWRDSNAPALPISEVELDEVTPLLYNSGTAALGWRRISKTPLGDCPSAQVLRQAYRLQSLHSGIHEQKIKKVFSLLRQARIPAVLAKGWVSAGMYADRALRPYGDLDICVRPKHFESAQEVLSVPEANDCWVDLHDHFSEIGERTFDELFARSRMATLGEEEIRMMGLEDQLALSSIHLLKHGAWRPLWLCDIAVAIESLPETFDWDLCLGSNHIRAHWTRCVIGLAQRLLRADTSKVPSSLQTQLPTWLIENVIRQWSNPVAIDQPPMSHPIPMSDLLRQPSGLLAGLRQRWPNPILATVSVNGRFNSFPPLRYQMANCISRMVRMFARKPHEAP